MFLAVFGIIVTLVLFFTLGVTKGGWKMRPRQLLSLFGIVLVVLGCIGSVPTGHTGILTTFGKVEDRTLEAGLHFKLPVQEIVIMDNRTQKSQLVLPCFSSDIQEVQVTYSINYQIQKENAQTIYKTIGQDYYRIVMEPRIEEAVRSVIAKYSAESLIENRDKLSVDITAKLETDLDAYNIEVINTAIEDLDFSDAFTSAVEEKQVAQQKLLKAQTEEEQLNMQEEAKAEREVIAAEAAAEVQKIQAQADAEVLKIQADAAEYAGQKDAAVNKAIGESLTELLIKYYELEHWDGKLPEYYISGTEGVLPVIGGAAAGAN